MKTRLIQRLQVIAGSLTIVVSALTVFISVMKYFPG